jgi:tRNA threonylcarbamoyladenosine biosynthesis protein TsaB
MNILAIETATQQASVALSGAKIPLASTSFVGGANASQQVLPIIQTLLHDHGVTIDAIHLIAVSYGPGSFTGIRLACAIAQGLSMPHAIPIAPINTLDNIAWQYPKSATIFAYIDARMQEIYGCVYKKTPKTLTPLTKVQLIPMQHITRLPHQGPIIGMGNIDLKERGLLCKQWVHTHPTATSLTQIARKMSPKKYCSADQLKPFYVRNHVASPKTAS